MQEIVVPFPPQEQDMHSGSVLHNQATMQQQNGAHPGDAPSEAHTQRLADGQACLDAALDYLARGLSVVQDCHPDHVGVGTAHARDCAMPGKVPMHPWVGLRAHPMSPERCVRLWAEYPHGNVGLILGQGTGLIRLDIDGEAGEARLQALSQGDVPPTWTFTSGSGTGRGLLYRWPADRPCHTMVHKADGLHEELRVQGDGAQTVVPPSRHSSGARYTWAPGLSPDEHPLADAPAWLLDYCTFVATPGSAPSAPGTVERAKVESALAWLVNTAARGAPGEVGYDGWLHRGMELHSTGESWAYEAWDSWSRQSPKYQESVQQRTWVYFRNERDSTRTIGSLFHAAQQAGWRWEPPREPAGGDEARLPKPLPLSDYTNAIELVRDHGGNVRYVTRWKQWLTWTGTHWQLDDCGAMMGKAKQTIRRLHARAATMEPKKGDALVKHIKTSLSTHKLHAMIESAQSEPGVHVAFDALDDAPWLLPCANGTLDLQSGTMQPARRANLLTRCLSVAYDPEAACPTWDAFLSKVLGEDKELIAFVQRAIGYTLTGVIHEHVLLILWGSGRNGKSTFLNTISALLGPYAMKANAELLLASDNDRHATEKADLFRKRFVAAIEAEQGRRLAESFIKEATGGDSIRARRLYEDGWEFKPTHKLFMATNHKPVVRGTDVAIWERLKLIPFTVRITEPDTALPSKLLGELPGILAWAVRGCRDWQAEGLGEPTAVRDATASYRSEQDILGTWITDCCLTGESYRVKATSLYTHYKGWCDEQGVRFESRQAWGLTMAERGYAYTRLKTGYWWIGIAPRDIPLSEEDAVPPCRDEKVGGSEEEFVPPYGDEKVGVDV